MQEPPKPEAAADGLLRDAKHYICTMLGLILAVHFYSAYVQNTALIGKTACVPCAAYVQRQDKNRAPSGPGPACGGG